MEARNNSWREYTQYKIDRNKFINHLGFVFTSIEPGRIEGALEFKEFHEQQNGYLHGGITSTLCDMVSGFASYTLVEQDQQVFTVECKVSYLNPGIAEKFFARGWVVKAGKRFHFCESEVYYLKDRKEVIIAKGSTTMGVIEAGVVKGKAV
jgi:uncharacterized protein (TIGR00369 family)